MRTVITKAFLIKMFALGDEQAAEYHKHFKATFAQYEITTPERIAAFFGQVAVESGELKFTEEQPSRFNKRFPDDPTEPVGTLYENRKNLGNNRPGDGTRFIGRGLIQISGRENYQKMSQKLGIDLVTNPELAATPEVAVKIACQYFKDKKLNDLADKWDLEKITEGVNGKTKLHHRQRELYSLKALKLLKQLSL